MIDPNAAVTNTPSRGDLLKAASTHLTARFMEAFHYEAKFIPNFAALLGERSIVVIADALESVINQRDVFDCDQAGEEFFEHLAEVEQASLVSYLEHEAMIAEAFADGKSPYAFVEEPVVVAPAPIAKPEIQVVTLPGAVLHKAKKLPVKSTPTAKPQAKTKAA
jgi:hypothetical protein